MVTQTNRHKVGRQTARRDGTSKRERRKPISKKGQSGRKGQRRGIWWDKDTLWTVEHIVDARVSIDAITKRKIWLYHTKWYNWANKDNTFEPEESFSTCKYPVLGSFWKATGFEEEPDANRFPFQHKIVSSRDYREAAKAALDRNLRDIEREEGNRSIRQLLKEGIKEARDQLIGTPMTPFSDNDNESIQKEHLHDPGPTSSSPHSFEAASAATPGPSSHRGLSIKLTPRRAASTAPAVTPADMMRRLHKENSMYATPDVDARRRDSSPAQHTVDPTLLTRKPLARKTALLHPNLFTAASTTQPRVSHARSRSSYPALGTDSRASVANSMGNNERTTTVSMRDPGIGGFQRHTVSSRGTQRRQVIIMDPNYSTPTGESKWKYVSAPAGPSPKGSPKPDKPDSATPSADEMDTDEEHVEHLVLSGGLTRNIEHQTV